MARVDAEALAGLARGDGGVQLGEVMMLGTSACLEVGHGCVYQLPFPIAGDGAPRFVMTVATASPTVAVAHPTIASARWVHLGTVVRDGASTLAALVFTTDGEARHWWDRWQQPPVAEAVGGAVRLASSKGRDGVRVDGAGAPVRVYVGFAADRDVAVAFVLDASVAEEVEREGEDPLHTQRGRLAAAPPGDVELPARPIDLHPFVANTAPGVPRLVEQSDLPYRVTGVLVGELVLPSRSMKMIGASFDGEECWATATDRMEVLAFCDGDELAAWVVRAPGRAAITRWVDGGFEDTTVVADGDTVLEPEEWSTGDRALPLMIESNHLFVDGPDLSVAQAFLGLDADDRATALVVLTA